MKLVTYTRGGGESRAGLLVGNDLETVLDLERVVGAPWAKTVLGFVEHAREGRAAAEKAIATRDRAAAIPAKDVVLHAPIPRPPSMRDGYAFRQHVETARKNRGLDMIPEFDQFPVFYFTNHQAVVGPGPVRVKSKTLEKLDF